MGGGLYGLWGARGRVWSEWVGEVTSCANLDACCNGWKAGILCGDAGPHTCALDVIRMTSQHAVLKLLLPACISAPAVFVSHSLGQFLFSRSKGGTCELNRFLCTHCNELALL